MTLKYSFLALAGAAILFCASAVPTSDSQQTATCAVCPSSIVFEGQTRTLTLAEEETGNIIQCNYDTPAISGLNPFCVYNNIGGALVFSNTGGACTSPTMVSQPGPSCTTALS
ncbi:hypothetical protein BDP27DRAFT_1451079 [Rhodocollybia butyracea]|uniref:Uncharacterized protein n=1 Tax=Rhodocollybia butyracea TaxID=206335 RepID=A0A9P5PEL2_9AGAR|nr:hypothetical protein BDP27DRAFT_1451079 [Rhodocollybia butyracea]